MKEEGITFPDDPYQMTLDQLTIAVKTGLLENFTIGGEDIGTIITQDGGGGFTIDVPALYEKLQKEKSSGSRGTFEEADLGQVLEDSRRFPRSGYKPSTDPTELAKTGGRDFGAFARDAQANIHKNAYIDLGLDVDRAMNMPAAERIKLVSGQIAKKFNLKVNVDNNMDAKLALDHMLDMYNSIAFMVHALGLPAEAIGLGGTLTLNINKSGRYLGVYKPGEKAISIPDKGNSFAHEWLHAFDHFLFVREERGEYTGDLFSGVVRKEGIDPMAGSRGSFVNLLNNIFFDKSHLAAKILELQNMIAEGSTETKRAEARETLAEIERGTYKGLKTRSEYYRGAREFSKGASYWTEPEEMMARAFEAYLAHKVEEGGGSVKGIAKADMGYLSNADDRLAKTFPKATDRFSIFGAFDRLFSDISREAILGDPSQQVELPDMDLGVVDPKRWDVLPITDDDKSFLQRIYDREREAYARDRKILERIQNKKVFKEALGIPNDADFIDATIALQQNTFRTILAVSHSIEKKYPRASSLREANNRLMERPGSAVPGESTPGKTAATGAVGETFAEELSRIAGKFQNRIDNIIEELKIEKFSDDEMNSIRDEMQGRPLGVKNEKISAAATALRTVLDSTYQEMKDAGVDIGYLRDSGYLTRMYMDDIILAKKEDFLEKANEVYGVQFDRDIGGVDAIMTNPAAFLDTVIEMQKHNRKLFPVPMKQMREIFLLLDNQQRTEEETAKLRDMLEQALPILREYYATTSANSWLLTVEVGRRDDSSASRTGVTTNFTKKRTLPPEADVILKNYMETDPLAITKVYVERAARKIAIHNVKNPKNGVPLSKLYERAREEGVSANDIELMEQYHNRIMGLHEVGALSKSIAPAMDWAYTVGTVMLLGRAVTASLPEAMTAAVKTGNVMDAARYYKYTLDQVRGTQDAKTFDEVAKFIGLVSNDMAAQSIDARLGGTGAKSKKTKRILSNFFRKTLLTPLTNHQRQIVLRISYRYFQYLSEGIRTKTGTDKNLALRELMEYGIPEDQAESFALWVKDFPGFIDENTGMPSAELDAPFGKMLIVAMRRFNKQVIQDPTVAERPYLASTPLGQVIFSVTSFQFSFWEKVVKAQARKIASVTKTEGSYEGAKMFGATVTGFAALYAATFIFQAMKLALFDHDKWEELEEKDELIEFLMKRSLAYTSIQGPVLDFLINVYAGWKWQRDLATAAAGAHLSTFFEFLQKLGELSAQNSENTNTAERNAVKHTWRVLAGPALAMALAQLPGGPLLGALHGAGIMLATSQTAAGAVADVAAGPKKESKKKKKPD
jgi:hypothetical protein